MGRTTRLTAALAGPLAALLMAVPQARADDFTTLYNAYRQSGAIAPCRFSAVQLQHALSEVPPDIQQYAPDFPNALQRALAARAAGACAGASSGSNKSGSAVTPPTTTTPSGAPPSSPSSTSGPGGTPGPTPVNSQPPGSIAPTVTHARATGASVAPAPIIALAAVMAVFALAALLWLLASARGTEPPWLGHVRHAFAEAGYRASGTLEEFGDWLRMGR
jgi:hypothetical protein